MHALFFSGPAAVVFAGVMLAVWHFRRYYRNWDFRKSDYAWVFFQGGVAYVMAVFLVEHFYYEVSYADILNRNFGGNVVTLAFFGALWESLKSLWDLWWGDGHTPKKGRKAKG